MQERANAKKKNRGLDMVRFCLIQSFAIKNSPNQTRKSTERDDGAKRKEEAALQTETYQTRPRKSTVHVAAHFSEFSHGDGGSRLDVFCRIPRQSRQPVVLKCLCLFAALWRVQHPSLAEHGSRIEAFRDDEVFLQHDEGLHSTTPLLLYFTTQLLPCFSPEFFPYFVMSGLCKP